MTDEFKQYVTDLIKYCREESFHGEYDYKVIFRETPSKEDTDNNSVKMEIKTDSVYLYFRIYVYPEVFEYYKDGNYKEIGKFALHEICHIFLEPIVHLFMWDVSQSQKSYVVETVERQTQRIANTFWCLLPKEWYTPESLQAKKNEASQ